MMMITMMRVMMMMVLMLIFMMMMVMMVIFSPQRIPDYLSCRQRGRQIKQCFLFRHLTIQMMYYDPNEYIGHSIVIDGVEAFTCIAPIAGQTSKYKTCFIGGLVYIPPRAKVGIKMLYAPRRVCLFEDTSYFGMFRVT